MSFLLKGEPPDVSFKIKLIQYHGKALESQMRMKPKLLHLGADYPVSSFEKNSRRGYNAVIKSVDEPEVDPTHNSASQVTNQDICEVKTSYLTLQDGFHQEILFHGFYTHKYFLSKWNHPQIYQEKKYMNFTNQKFPSHSICEYQSLEGYLSPIKKRPDPNKIMNFKMDILNFQQEENEEKFPLKSKFMAHFPKPVKTVLHLPKLEDPKLPSN